MATTTWNSTVIAECDKHGIFESNVYFPPKTIKKEYFKDSEPHTVCSWREKRIPLLHTSRPQTPEPLCGSGAGKQRGGISLQLPHQLLHRPHNRPDLRLVTTDGG